MTKIKVDNPIVEMDGDEMTRIIWDFIKKKLILPYLDVDLLYYDLGIESRDATDDQITIEAAEKTREVGVAVKCATITPDEGPRGGIRAQEDVAQPERHEIRNILAAWCSAAGASSCRNVPRLVPGWTQPIVIGANA